MGSAATIGVGAQTPRLAGLVERGVCDGANQL